MSQQNKMVFSKNVASFEADYWRQDEEQAVKFLKPGKLLIGGVGAGRTIPHLQKKGFIDITAIDISPEMVKKSKERWPKIDVSEMDLQKTSFSDNTFDSIFLPFHTLAYVDDLYMTLEEMGRILKPEGTLLFSIPNYWYIRSILHGDIFKGGRHSTTVTRNNKNSLSTIFMSMIDVWRVRKIFPFVKVRGRVSLQHLKNPNWKDRVLEKIPFIDKSLYFFASNNKREIPK